MADTHSCGTAKAALPWAGHAISVDEGIVVVVVVVDVDVVVDEGIVVVVVVVVVEVLDVVVEVGEVVVVDEIVVVVVGDVVSAHCAGSVVVVVVASVGLSWADVVADVARMTTTLIMMVPTVPRPNQEKERRVTHRMYNESRVTFRTREVAVARREGLKPST